MRLYYEPRRRRIVSDHRLYRTWLARANRVDSTFDAYVARRVSEGTLELIVDYR